MEKQTVLHLPLESRFCITGLEAKTSLEYRLEGSTLSLTHTWIDPELRGGSLASDLVQAAVDWAKALGYTVNPVCSYTVHWMRHHNPA